MKEKATALARKVRQRQQHHFNQMNFCIEHKMKLDEIKHREIAEELNKAANEIEEAFDLGYVSIYGK